MNYNLRIIQEYFRPKIGSKIRIFSLAGKTTFFSKKKKKSVSNYTVNDKAEKCALAEMIY